MTLVSLIIFWRLLGIKSWNEIGWGKGKYNLNHFIGGLLLGSGSLVLLSSLALSLGERYFNNGITAAHWGNHFAATILGGIIISAIEETIFRGVLYMTLRRDHKFILAASLSALFYASVHFIDQKPSITGVNWTTGFTSLPYFIHDFAGDPYWPAAFINIFLAGLILAGLTERTGNLYFAIGTHAGWIISTKTDAFATYPANVFFTHVTQNSKIWGLDNITNGWAATPLLTIIACYIFLDTDEQSNTESN